MPLVKSGDGSWVAFHDPKAAPLSYLVGMFFSELVWQVNRRTLTSPIGSDSFLETFQSLVDLESTDRVCAAGDTTIRSFPAAGTIPGTWTDEISSLFPGSYRIRLMRAGRVGHPTLLVGYWGIGQHYPDISICRYVGDAWQKTNRTGVSHPAGAVNDLVVSDHWENEFWTVNRAPAGQPKILHMLDDGANFEDWTGNLADPPQVRCLAVTPFDPDIAYRGTDLGVYRTTDGGESWQPFQTGLPIGVVRRMRLVVDDALAGNHRLVVATYGRGTWTRVVPGPPIVYVDRANTGPQDGTWQHPFATLTAAIQAAPSGAIVAMKSDTYSEPQTITKNLRLVTYGGSSLIH